MSKKITVYPSDRAIKILGSSATRLNQAIDVFADAVAHHSININYLDRKFWLFFIDCLNGFWANENYRMVYGLTAQFEDCQAIDGIATKHGITQKEFAKFMDWFKEDASDFDAWAIIFACQFFWDNHEKIDVLKDEFWTIPFRLQFNK